MAGRHHRLAAGERSAAEILNLIDDHSRLFLGSDAYGRVKAADVMASFHNAAQLHGLPYSLLSDNGAVFTGSYRGGKVLLESELERLGVLFKNSRPYHPQTCGKIERLHQTLKRYLAKQPPARTLTSSRPSSTPSRTTTTTSGPIEPLVGAHRYRPTAPA